MKHDFSIRRIPPGDSYTDETCSKCDLVRRRYGTGAIRYLVNGLFISTGPVCTDEQKPVEPKKDIDVILIEEPPPKPRKIIHTDPDLPARLSEAMVLINLMYYDLCRHDVECKSRRMAGDFLKTQGYSEILRELDKTA